jgi:peptidoglycan/xylan/chitin deacetylase (PgdA/CDA1 family)
MIGGENGLTHGMLREMAGAGMSFGSHTVTHPRLPRIEPTKVRTELGVSKEILQGHPRQTIAGLAYPYGACDEATATSSKAAGYAYALGASLQTSFANRYCLPRAVILERSYFGGDYARLHGAQEWRRAWRIWKQRIPNVQ